jgi:hypothetical protein
LGQRLSRAHYDVLLVGSVPLDDAEAVFRSAAGMIGRRMQRIPDGETGERLRWIEWQIGVFDRHPDFEQTDEGVKADWRNNGVASSWKDGTGCGPACAPTPSNSVLSATQKRPSLPTRRSLA